MVPTTVEMLAVASPTITLFQRYRWTSLFWATYSYQRKLNPSQCMTR